MEPQVIQTASIWPDVLKNLAVISPLAIAAVGSCFGIGAASLAAIGGMKKLALENKPEPAQFILYLAAPVSQTIYGMIVMSSMIKAINHISGMWIIGVGAGIGLAYSAYFQGLIGAAASDALGSTGKASPKYIIALGVIETVAILVMVFSMQAITGLSK